MSLLIPHLEILQSEFIVGPLHVSELMPKASSNPEVSSWYEGLSDADKLIFADLKNGQVDVSSQEFSLLGAVSQAVDSMSGLTIGGVYQRKFKRGEGEGEHTDPHDIVVTQTTGAGAEFRLWDGKKPTTVELKDGDILLFHGRTRHEVGPANNRLRIVDAIGIDQI